MRINMRRRTRILTAGLLASMFMIPVFPAPTASGTNVVYADETISDIKEKNAERERKKEEAQSKLDSLNTQADDIRSVISQLDDEINEYQGTIDELTAKRNALQAKASVTKSDLQIALIAKENQYDRMKERIAYSYENGDIHLMDALIALDDFSNVINQSEYVEQVSSYDQEQLTDLINISKEVKKKEKQLKDQLAEVEEIKADAEAEQDALQVMQDGKKEKLNEFAGLISETEGEISEYEALIEEGNAEIKRLEEEYKRKQEEARKRREAAAAAAAAAERERQQQQREQQEQQQQEEQQSDSSDDADDDEDEKYQEPEYNDSGWTWPCPASHHITSYFGYRTAPVAGATTYHQAIDIGVGIGNSVVAAKGGTVMYTSYSSARGNYIRIDHGGGVTSLYQHLSGFAGYSAGDSVSAGTVIAYSGMTGICAGAHLHFEIWVNGTPVNPLNYVG